MNYDSCGEDYLMGGSQALFIGERFQEEFGRLPDIGEGLLGLTALQFRAPCALALAQCAP